MPKFNAYVPVDIKVTLDQRGPDVAADKARYAVDYFIANALPYKLTLPGIGAIELTLVHAELPEDEDDEPFVEEVFAVATTDSLGGLSAPDYAQPFEGACVLAAPADFKQEG